MANLEEVIASNHEAVGAFVKAARSIGRAQWSKPRAPGKWSPGQVTEHVALAYEQNRRMLHGTFEGHREPWYRQIVGRLLFLPRMFRRRDFGKGPFVAPDFLRPADAAAPAGEALARLETAAGDLERDVSSAAAAGRPTFDHAIFGRMPVKDLLRFLILHTEHHLPQLNARGNE